MDDIYKLVKWSEKWHMLLNINAYTQDMETILGRTTAEKDLGVTFSADMKVSGQCSSNFIKF